MLSPHVLRAPLDPVSLIGAEVNANFVALASTVRIVLVINALVALKVHGTMILEPLHMATRMCARCAPLARLFLLQNKGALNALTAKKGHTIWLIHMRRIANHVRVVRATTAPALPAKSA